MRTRWIGLAAAALIGFALRPALALDEVSYEAALDKSQITLGEKVQYLVIIHYGLNTLAPTVTPPSFSQFKVLNEYQTNLESPGENDHHLIFKKIWLLQPEETGRLSIAAALVTYQDPTTNLLKNGKTAVRFLTVSASPEAIPGPQSATAPAQSKFPLGWLAVGSGALLALLGVLGLTGHRSPGKAGRRLPEETALNALQAAIERLSQDHADLATYYASLTSALFEYLQTKYGLAAHKLSTTALLGAIRRLGFAETLLAELHHFLQVAEKAKFAGYVPEEDEMISLHGILTRFIETGRRISSRRR
jgi:hypothetical protein